MLIITDDFVKMYWMTVRSMKIILVVAQMLSGVSLISSYYYNIFCGNL